MVNLPIAPELQAILRTTAGSFVGRVDFYWRGLGVVGEADGREKYSDAELWREKQREDRLTDLGLVVTRWDWATAQNPQALQHLLLRAFGKAELLRSAGIPIAAVTQSQVMHCAA